MKRFLHLSLLYLALSVSSVHSGIIERTPVLIKHPLLESNKKNVEDLQAGDEVLTYIEDQNVVRYEQTTIVEIYKKEINDVIYIKTESGEFIADPEELFFNSKKETWIKAKNLTTDDSFSSIQLDYLKIKKIELITLQESIDVYCLTLKKPHIFYICDSANNPILIHNEFAMGTIALTFAAVPEAAPFVAAAGVGYVGYKLYKGFKSFFHHRKMKKQQVSQEQQDQESWNGTSNNQFIGGAPQPPEDPKDDDEKDSSKGEEVVRGKGKAPKTAKPNSRYIKVHNENPKTIVSETKYNKFGKPEYRNDYISRGARDHANMGNHKHIFSYNSTGQLTGKTVIPI